MDLPDLRRRLDDLQTRGAALRETLARLADDVARLEDEHAAVLDQIVAADPGHMAQLRARADAARCYAQRERVNASRWRRQV